MTKHKIDLGTVEAATIKLPSGETFIIAPSADGKQLIVASTKSDPLEWKGSASGQTVAIGIPEWANDLICVPREKTSNK